jgi:hypothetical protein
MKEIYCLPLTAATNKLHLGNLYSWILADSYKRASKVLGKDVEIKESWNCFSKKLEDEISSRFILSGKELVYKCQENVEENIALAQDIFYKYGIHFSKPAIRDDSPQYKEVVIKDYEKRNKNGEVENFFLKIPPFIEILRKAKYISFHPKSVPNSLNGISILKGVSSVPILRKGEYGIGIEGMEGVVFGQRYVQSLLPEFYRAIIGIPELAIFGKDVLVKWVYFMIANSNFVPFNNLGLHGLILKKNGGKISKYDSYVPLIKDIDSHPDTVRLSLLKQTFGLDFKYPNFEDEEKFRRKIENCLNFFINYRSHKKIYDEDDFEFKIDLASKDISNKIRNLNFSEAYQDFKSLIYKRVSSEIIPLIQNRGISQKSLDKIILEFSEISKVFAPITIEYKLSQKFFFNL